MRFVRCFFFLHLFRKKFESFFSSALAFEVCLRSCCKKKAVCMCLSLSNICHFIGKMSVPSYRKSDTKYFVCLFLFFALDFIRRRRFVPLSMVKCIENVLFAYTFTHTQIALSHVSALISSSTISKRNFLFRFLIERKREKERNLIAQATSSHRNDFRCRLNPLSIFRAEHRKYPLEMESHRCLYLGTLLLAADISHRTYLP